MGQGKSRQVARKPSSSTNSSNSEPTAAGASQQPTTTEPRPPTPMATATETTLQLPPLASLDLPAPAPDYDPFEQARTYPYTILAKTLTELSKTVHIVAHTKEENLALFGKIAFLCQQGNVAAQAAGFVDLVHYYACRRVGLGRDWRNREWGLNPMVPERAARIAFEVEEKSEEAKGEGLLVEWLGEEYRREVAARVGEEVMVEDRHPEGSYRHCHHCEEHVHLRPEQVIEEYHCWCGRPNSFNPEMVVCDVEGCDHWDHIACSGKTKAMFEAGHPHFCREHRPQQLAVQERSQSVDSEDLYSSTPSRRPRNEDPAQHTNCHLCPKPNGEWGPIIACNANNCENRDHVACCLPEDMKDADLENLVYHCDQHQSGPRFQPKKRKGKKKGKEPAVLEEMEKNHPQSEESEDLNSSTPPPEMPEERQPNCDLCDNPNRPGPVAICRAEGCENRDHAECLPPGRAGYNYNCDRHPQPEAKRNKGKGRAAVPPQQPKTPSRKRPQPPESEGVESANGSTSRKRSKTPETGTAETSSQRPQSEVSEDLYSLSPYQLNKQRKTQTAQAPSPLQLPTPAISEVPAPAEHEEYRTKSGRSIRRTPKAKKH